MDNDFLAHGRRAQSISGVVVVTRESEDAVAVTGSDMDKHVISPFFWLIVTIFARHDINMYHTDSQKHNQLLLYYDSFKLQFAAKREE